MGEKTRIGWTHHTFNFWVGCTKISPECENCYIPRAVRKSPDEVFKGPKKTKGWSKPVGWNRKAAEAGERRRVFTCSVSDFFHADADPWRSDAWQVIRSCPDLDWLILTKQAKRIVDHLPTDWGDGYDNVWLGVTVGCEASMCRLPYLRQVPAKVKFVSVEPLLERLDFRPFLDDVDWVITGCEKAGKDKRRGMNIDWVRDIDYQCQYFDVPHFFKQAYMANDGKICNQPLLDGRIVQQFPSPRRRETKQQAQLQVIRFRPAPIAVSNSQRAKVAPMERL